MTNTLLRILSLPLLATCLPILNGCGSGGGGNATTGIDGSGSPVPALAVDTRGSIDAFGSVILNGTRYETRDALILINGQSASEDALHPGYVIDLRGSIASSSGASAQRLDFRPSLVGNLQTIDPATQQLQLLGQTVQLQTSTSFASDITPADISGLIPGERLLISGQRNPQGIWVARRVERSALEPQLIGTLSALDASERRFSLNGTTVDATAARFDGVNGNRLRDGMLLQARGRWENDILVAEVIAELNDSPTAGTLQISRDGFITAYTSPSAFSLGNLACTTDSQTRFINGSAANLALGQDVEVKGRLNANGILQIESLSFTPEDNNRVEGTLTSLSLSTENGISLGTLELSDGSRVQTTATTRYEDKSDTNLRRFSLANLQTGDYLEVRGYTSDNRFIASRLERRKPTRSDSQSSKFSLRGTVTTVDNLGINILSQRLVFSENTEFLDDKGPIDRNSFISRAPGALVKAEGRNLQGSNLLEKIQLEKTNRTPD
jgi:hypothetical protein